MKRSNPKIIGSLFEANYSDSSSNQAQPQTMAWTNNQVQPQPQPQAGQYAPDRQVGGDEMLDAHRTLGKIQADHLTNLPIAQKLELVLKQSTTAEKTAYRALKGLSDFDRKLDKIFAILKNLGGTQAQPKTAENDPESIF